MGTSAPRQMQEDYMLLLPHCWELFYYLLLNYFHLRRRKHSCAGLHLIFLSFNSRLWSIFMAAVFQKAARGKASECHPSLQFTVTQVRHSYPVSMHWGKKQAAVDIKTYLLKVTRKNAAVAMALNMPWGKKIPNAAIIALILTMMTGWGIHSSCIQQHICSVSKNVIILYALMRGVLAETSHRWQHICTCKYSPLVELCLNGFYKTLLGCLQMKTQRNRGETEVTPKHTKTDPRLWRTCTRTCPYLPVLFIGGIIADETWSHFKDGFWNLHFSYGRLFCVAWNHHQTRQDIHHFHSHHHIWEDISLKPFSYPSLEKLCHCFVG